MENYDYRKAFARVFKTQVRQTFTAYLLFRIKIEVKEWMSIKDANYTINGVEATLIDNVDKQEYLLTLTPKKTCDHKNTTNLAGATSCNDCGKVI